MNLVLTQTFALLTDAYRELNAKKLFWITILLTALVVIVFAMVGLNDRGLTFLVWEFPLPFLNAKNIEPAIFYKFIFATIGVPVWLTWIATVLALISTASIIPDFIASGAIELTLSKPIGRLRLFFTKFFTGMLFVALQVVVFTALCFLVIGIRGHVWEWGLWLAVPIVLLFFSYIFSFCALMGILTRSTIAALLITLLGWFVCWGINVTDILFLRQHERTLLEVEQREKIVATREKAANSMLEKAKADGTPVPTGPDELEAISPMLRFARTELKDARESEKTWDYWSTIAFRVKTFLPKTGETIALLDRHLLSLEDQKKFAPGGDFDETDEDSTDVPNERGRRIGRNSQIDDRLRVALRKRSIEWVIGTSLIFEGMILVIAGVVFRRRDF